MCEFLDQLRALASGASLDIIKVLAQHKPTPVPVHVIAEETGVKRSATSMHLARLRKVRLVGVESRRRGYFANTAEIKAVIGEQSYRKITQELRDQNDDTPGQS